MLALKYVKSWFFIDLIAVIPLRPFGEEDIEYIIRLTRLLKLPNVLNLFGGKVFAYFANFIRYGKITMDEAVDSFTARYAGLLFQSTLSMVLVIYIMGGIWFWY